jgi:4-oxalocrotonate tautomerase family enzyme
MPSVRIDLIEGKSPEFVKQLIETVGECVVNTLQLPVDDKNIRAMEYKTYAFMAKAPYQYFIEVYLFAGRTKETKAKLFQSIINSLERVLDINPKEVFIILNEQPKDNWAVRGGIQASDIDLGFKVDI